MRRILLTLALLLFLASPALAQTANGSITGTTCPGTGCVRLTVSSGVSSVLVQTWGTWAATLVFEGTAKPDSTGYFPLDGYPIPTAPSSTTTTTNGQWGLSVSGLKYVRVRATSYTSGTVLLLIQASSAGRVFSVNTSAATGGGAVGAGDASAANQVIGNDSLASIDSKMGSRTWNLDSLSDTVAVVQPEGTNLHIVCDAGCTGGGGAAGPTDVNITQVAGVTIDTLPVSLASVPTHAVTGPLTDTQLRATAVPVSLASVPSHAVTLASTTITNFPASQPVTNTGTFAVQVTSAPTTTVTPSAGSALNAQINGVNRSVQQGTADTGTARVVMAQEATYSAGTLTKTATAAGTGPFFSLCGSATRTIRVQRIAISGTVATAAVWGDVIVKTTSTATTGGTATALTRAPYDSTSPAVTATANFYTVLATTPGTLRSVVLNVTQLFPVTAISATLQPSPAPIIYQWRDQDAEAPTLRGVAECLTANFGTTTTNAPTLSVSVAWTEK